MKSTNKPKQFIANVKHRETGRRRRKLHKTATAAKLAEARDAVLQEKLATLGTTTLADAGQALLNRLVLSKKEKVAQALEVSLRCHLNTLFGAKQLRNVTYQYIVDIGRAIQALPFALNSVKRIMRDFFKVLRHGFKDVPLVARFPSQVPELCVRGAYGCRAIVNQHRPIPIGAELEARLTFAQGPLKVFLHLLAHAGLRPGEAIALRVGDVDLAKGIMRIRATTDWAGNRSKPKTAAGIRTVPMNSVLRALLANWIEQNALGLIDQVLSDKAGTVHLYNYLRDKHDVLERRLNQQHYNFHLYRSACVTIWLFAGLNLMLVREWIGHAHLRMTVQVYGNAIAVADDLWRKRRTANDNATKSPLERVQEALALVKNTVGRKRSA
ncbi:site-specific integrase [Devosia sp. BK]|uniref:site-specific integrase n=1 Tax=Devosia sp. BK TaxID=2871706 RepID=UPI00293A0F78|nr:site-specific integrase [Devosia sp. BK]MDV3253685.1 site-specific integrase [Devosia sp. BK]